MEKSASVITSFIIATISFLAGMGVFHAMNKRFGIKDDNVAEQVVEKVIEIKTGANIDLTPETQNQNSTSEQPKDFSTS